MTLRSVSAVRGVSRWFAKFHVLKKCVGFEPHLCEPSKRIPRGSKRVAAALVVCPIAVTNPSR